MSQAIGVLAGISDVDVDDALVLVAQDRPAEFARIYERYLPRVYRYLRARTASPEEAADLTQAVFLRAFDALPRYHAGRAPFAAWIFRIARNAATDAHRKRRGDLSWDGLPEALEPAAADVPEAVALRTERLAELRAVVAVLDPSKRELLALRFAGGLSAREFAPLVGKSEAAVKKQITRILTSLKEHCREDLS